MPSELLTQLKVRLWGRSERGGRQADDAETAAELLLLLRMVLADGPLGPRESEILRRIAATGFGLCGADGEAFMQQMRVFDCKVGAGQVTGLFHGLDIERRRMLARRLVDIMEEDQQLKAREARFRGRLLALLALDPDERLKSAAG